MNGELLGWMALLSRRIQREMGRRLAPMGVAAGTHGILLMVCDRPGLSQDELAERGLLNKSTVARALAQLEETGFVRRERPAEDRRMHRVYPTARALACLDEVSAHKRACEAALCEPLSDAECAELHRLIGKLYEHNALRPAQEDIQPERGCKR